MWLKSLCAPNDCTVIVRCTETFWSTCTFLVVFHPGGPGSPHYRGFTITLRHTILYRTPLDEWSARRRDLYFSTHNTHNRLTDIHAPGVFRTRHHNRRAVAVPHLRPRGHWFRHSVCYCRQILDIISMGQHIFCLNCSYFIKLCSSILELFYVYIRTEGLVRRATGLHTLTEKKPGLQSHTAYSYRFWF